MRRNPADALTGDLPVLSVDAADRLKATLGTDTQGSFNIILYCDANGDGQWQPPETLLVLNVAIVRITAQLEANNVVTQATGFKMHKAQPLQFESGTDANPAIAFNVQVTVEGGGADKLLGVDKILPNIGWLGNGVQTTRATIFTDGSLLAERFSLNGQPVQPPILDVNPGVPHPGTGGRTAYRKSSEVKDIQFPAAGGATARITAHDAPGYNTQEDCPAGGPFAVMTQGSLAFKDYLAVFSSDFILSYAVLGMATWAATFRFHYNQTTGLWEDMGCAVSGAGPIDVQGFPASAISKGVKSTPPILHLVLDSDRDHCTCFLL